LGGKITHLVDECGDLSIMNPNRSMISPTSLRI
jgi:hypothetical protein